MYKNRDLSLIDCHFSDLVIFRRNVTLCIFADCYRRSVSVNVCVFVCMCVCVCVCVSVGVVCVCVCHVGVYDENGLRSIR